MFCKWCGQNVDLKNGVCPSCGKQQPPMTDCGGFYNLVPGAKAAETPAGPAQPVQPSLRNNDRALQELRKQVAQESRTTRLLGLIGIGVGALALLLTLVLVLPLSSRVSRLNRELEALDASVRQAPAAQTPPELQAPPATQAPPETLPNAQLPPESGVPTDTQPGLAPGGQGSISPMTPEPQPTQPGPEGSGFDPANREWTLDYSQSPTRVSVSMNGSFPLSELLTADENGVWKYTCEDSDGGTADITLTRSEEDGDVRWTVSYDFDDDPDSPLGIALQNPTADWELQIGNQWEQLEPRPTEQLNAPYEVSKIAEKARSLQTVEQEQVTGLRCVITRRNVAGETLKITVLLPAEALEDINDALEHSDSGLDRGPSRNP